jgi:histidinol dehydrogenase
VKSEKLATAEMNIIKYPKQEEWAEICQRPHLDITQLQATVNTVLSDVRTRGDEAVKEYEERFDHAVLTSLAVTEAEIDEAERLVSEELKAAIVLAHENIHQFHAAQKFEGHKIQTREGVTCWQKSVAIEKVGLYIPGGTAPLFSTVLMLATPAKIAGCREIVLCTPPNREGKVNPAILVAARVAGVSKIFKAGGVQAIGAMAYGTQSVPKVFKIFGPGNQYVMAAKQQVSLGEVAIDMPAGPSEVCVLADETANPAFVAADLLSQAEHGIDSQVLLISTSEDMMQQVQAEVERQLNLLPRKEIAQKALENSRMVLVASADEMMALSNAYAPEHLIIQTKNYDEMAAQVINAGSVFLGQYACESAGDYASGTNHTLPTHGYATAYSGVNLDSYCRKITFQHLSEEGVRQIGRAVELMAGAEQLDAHKNAMTVRLSAIEK